MCVSTLAWAAAVAIPIRRGGRGSFLVLCQSRKELHYDRRNRNKHNPNLEKNAQPIVAFQFVDDPE